MVSFWPRHFHPLGPPAYGPNAVQELKKELSKAPDVTLSAHSQGSMIATIALTQMTSEEVDGLDQVVTYGSPLGLLYDDVFSRVGLGRILERKAGHEGLKWTNLWRKTDYLGGLPIPIPGDSNHLADDIGHSRYECTRQYADVIARHARHFTPRRESQVPSTPAALKGKAKPLIAGRSCFANRGLPFDSTSPRSSGDRAPVS